ncbi:hypothetical protein HELRODRAFT_98239 [Helobdella robusta]|uniref:Selenocysteine lyase n=1 Tax=Helobdella robusta TaxID=6412 RepID=T1G9L1_HELRO|nr:hypothetical protein HELRODRAFT_98239 [Helobdella robusta]ESO08113.1 hypothetical protein HELRODRAFT_98239 [Helobdella robusta]
MSATAKKVYLDNNATTPLDDEVLDEITYALKYGWGNPSSSYQNGVLAKDIISRSRHRVAEMINCKPEEIIFTSGGTESNNLVVHTAITQFNNHHQHHQHHQHHYHHHQQQQQQQSHHCEQEHLQKVDETKDEIVDNDDDSDIKDSNENNNNNNNNNPAKTKIPKLSKSISDSPASNPHHQQPPSHHQHHHHPSSPLISSSMSAATAAAAAAATQEPAVFKSLPMPLEPPIAKHHLPAFPPPIHHSVDEKSLMYSKNFIGESAVRCPTPHLIASELEHDSIKLVMRHYCEIGQARISFIKTSTKDGCVDVDELFSSITDDTCLISIMMANNETGIIQPIGEISVRLQPINESRTKLNRPIIFLHTDAAQAIGKVKVDVEELKVDFLTIVGHKFYGPRVGALYSRSCFVHPMLFGGGQEKNHRPGTENTGMIAGLGKACELVSRKLTVFSDHMKEVRNYLEDRLEETFPNSIHFNGRNDFSQRLPNTCNVSILKNGLKGHVILSKCQHLEASVGAACHSNLVDRPSSILLSIGVPEDVVRSAIRLSVGRQTTFEDVDVVVGDLKRTIDDDDDDGGGASGGDGNDGAGGDSVRVDDNDRGKDLKN